MIGARGSAADEPGWIEADHLVVAARNLDEAAAWCEATFGVAPVAGGRHATMGTHNRLLGLGGYAYPRTYLELIALDPDAKAPTRTRWFDLDSAALRASLEAGPRLVHWVARTARLDTAVADLRALGHDPGEPMAAERMTPHGLLRWRITLRDDGRRPAAGAVPLLIEWGEGGHPAEHLPASGVAIERIAIGGVDAAVAARLGVSAEAAGAALAVRFASPRGRVELRVG